MTKTLWCCCVSVLSVSAAHTAYDECAVVLKTPDGFLALREKPTARSKLLRGASRAEHEFHHDARGFPPG
jgi:hypothetical protein